MLQNVQHAAVVHRLGMIADGEAQIGIVVEQADDARAGLVMGKQHFFGVDRIDRADAGDGEAVQGIA